MDCTDGLDDWVDWVIAPDKFAPVKQKIKKVSPRWNGIKRFHWAGGVNSARDSVNCTG